MKLLQNVLMTLTYDSQTTSPYYYLCDFYEFLFFIYFNILTKKSVIILTSIHLSFSNFTTTGSPP